MPQKTVAGGLAPQKNMKNTLLYLPGAGDNDAAADNPAPAVSSGSRFWAGCVMIKDEPFRRNNL